MLFRSGDDQFDLQQRANAEPRGFKHPETVRRVLDNPNARIAQFPYQSTPHVYEDYHEPMHHEQNYEEESDSSHDSWEEVITFPSYYPHREYNFSGSDIAKLKRGR